MVEGVEEKEKLLITFTDDESDQEDKKINESSSRDTPKALDVTHFFSNMSSSVPPSNSDEHNASGDLNSSNAVPNDAQRRAFEDKYSPRNEQRNSSSSDTSNLINSSLSRSSSVSGSDCSSLLKRSSKSYEFPSHRRNGTVKEPFSGDISDCKIEYSSLDDNDSMDGNSENSFAVSRRIKNWFSSFGKGGGGGSLRRKKRDSTFYLDADNMIANSWDTGSVSSAEDKGTEEPKIHNKTSETNSTVLPDEDKAETATNETEIIDVPIEDKKQRKAYLVVREVISSEKVFIDVLKLLCHDFRQFVERLDTDIPEHDLSKIINYLPQLLSFNEDLLHDLEDRVNNWIMLPKISDIVVKKGPFLKLYSTYIQNFERQCSFLDDCCHKYPKFSKAVKEFESTDRCKKLTIKHYMLKPIQRIPQYRLLLQDYLNQQDRATSIDYDDTEHALKIVCDVAEHANKCVELDTTLRKLLQLQSQLGNYEIIKPGREFVKAGELYKLSRKGLQLRYFILLNDCLLYTSYYGSMINLKVNHELPLTGMKVCVPQVEDYHNEFSIISITRSFTLRTRCINEREEWVNVLSSTIKEHNKRQLSFMNPKLLSRGELMQPLNLGKEAPIWVPDHRVTMCQACTAEFKVTFRRHHCRACGKVVCSTCSDNRAPLQYMNFQVARVCDECYEYLLKDFEETDPAERVKEHLDLDNEDDVITTVKNLKLSFKKHDLDPSRKFRKQIPMRLKEVTANDTGSRMSGWLYRKSKRSWKRYWFVLKEQVLYVYKASEDVKALETIPVLGYAVETFKLSSNTYEDIDSKCVFQLAHANQQPVVFHAGNEHTADKWVQALEEATNLS